MGIGEVGFLQRSDSREWEERNYPATPEGNCISIVIRENGDLQSNYYDRKPEWR
jgi:hypothetical protein